MILRRDIPLAEFTTLRLGGPAAQLMTVDDTDELVATVAQESEAGLLLLGSGSNLVVGDRGVQEPVIHVGTKGIEVMHRTHDVELVVAAGESWETLVDLVVGEGWSGLEALAGIPGTVGATPIQNVGAYGQEVSDVITSVQVYDRSSNTRREMDARACAFGYRTSIFKQHPHRYVVLRVHFRLVADRLGLPIRYVELAAALGVDVGERAPLKDVREAVLSLRRRKGMVLDPSDHDTWSAGSFFTNPILHALFPLPSDAPRWDAIGGVKVSAAWLIQSAGFGRGFGSDVGSGRITVSNKHTLALTNRGGATTDELLVLARLIRSGVRDQFGVELRPEPTLVGVEL